MTAANFTLSGTVADGDGQPLAFATVGISGAGDAAKAILTDAEGCWAIRLEKGEYMVEARYVGFKTALEKVRLEGDARIVLTLRPAEKMLGEVVITSRENGGMTSSSRIDRDAMKHLQPTSFTDLLELLPGNISADPDMRSTNSITLRETGNLGATGQKSVSDDYAISSLGTAFVVDGAPINGDANLAGVPDAAAGDAASKRSVVNRGVDMRAISTDNIESVDIIRGIPSAEYGNLSSGMVNIRRIRRATPFTARFKADQYSKLFSAGKGFAIKSTDHVINADMGWLDSKVDPRDNLESYKRLTASVRATLRWRRGMSSMAWNIGADYSGSFDDAKIDPDLNFNKIDEFKSRYNRVALTSDFTLTSESRRWYNMLNVNLSASAQNDEVERHKQVSPQRASVAPTTMSEGVHDGVYLLGEYIADFKSQNRPVNLFAKIRAGGSAGAGAWLNEYKAGVEWTLSKNLGYGQRYDLTRPLSASWTTRPRDYSEIPALHTLSFFAEDNISATAGDHKFQLQLGVRGIALPKLDTRYYLAGRPYFDPRLNAEWGLPPVWLGGNALSLRIGGGYGLTTRMPTVDYLYPQVHYADMVQLNYYDILDPLNHSRVSLRTYVSDATNYDLRPARNHKWEMRLNAEFADNRLSVTYFEERMNDGFRYSSVFTPRSYTRYDASNIDPATLAAAPSLEDLPSTPTTVLDGMSRVENGSRLDKRGIEYQLVTARFQPLHTSLIINGAWFRSRYSNSRMLYYPVNAVVGNQAVSDYYVGIYDSDDGRVNEQFNTNFMFDTQIPRWGLTFSTTLQCMWWVKSTRLRDNGVPVSYLATDGLIHPFTEEALSDPMLAQLVRSFNEDSYRTVKVPTALYVNLKVTKRIGRWLNMAAFVNRIVDYLPDYKSNGITIRRSSEAYFGMEASITI